MVVNMKCVINFIILILPFSLAINSDYVYEFGSDQGQIIYTKDGTIYLFQRETNIDIPVPTGMAVSYVKITVNALSPPKVDYDNLYHRVSIKYSWVQIAQSTYNIIVKGIPNA
ncbi:uncharacterized protein LOC106721607 [Papilio machaon]|uniref:uncharacterized protein LOC106721607 n=1 Tax=Papilio machaon TaxID=76193 RepID=UPI0006EAE35D|nr:uncharacterized protein LOC106721607 [Papilio machaon]